MRLTDAQIKQVVRWIKRNLIHYRSHDEYGYVYDCTVAAEVCERELELIGRYDDILNEIEYYAVNKDG
jgi:hypothetical protein